MSRLLNSAYNLNNRFWAKLVNTTDLDVRSLSVFRIITGLYLLFISAPSFIWISQMPEALFSPPVFSPVNFFSDGLPGKQFFLWIDLILLFCGVCITLGIKARTASVLFVIVRVVASNFRFSFGKIDHDILVIAGILCMSFSDWGYKLALFPDKPLRLDSPSRSLSLLAVIICFGFFTAGSEKAFTWINFDMHANGTGWWYYNAVTGHQKEPLLSPLFKIAPFWLFKVMDYVAVVFELVPFLFVLHSRKAWRIWLLIACVFHLANLLIFDINFMKNGIMYLAFIDYTRVYYYLQRIFSNYVFKIATALIVGYITVFRLYNIIYLNRSETLMNRAGNILLWLVVITIFINSIRHTPAKKAEAKADEILLS